MAISFCAVMYPTGQMTDRALSHGFAVALAGWDAPHPSLSIAELATFPGWSVAFYRSGVKGSAKSSELDHFQELFDDELPPGLAVRDAAERDDCVVYSILYSDELTLDDAAKFSEDAMERRFVREGDEGIEAGVETVDECEVTVLDTNDGGLSDPTHLDALLRPHRGSTFLARELGAQVLPALVRALFEEGRNVDVRFFEASPAAIADEVRRLNRVLARENGRGAFIPPPDVAGVSTPKPYEAFAVTYDFADPADKLDLYRELSLGRIEGALRFLRRDDLAAFASDPRWKPHAAEGLFPIATLGPSSLGGSTARPLIIALSRDEDSLFVVEADRALPAGPTFAELLRYLSLGWKSRDDVEEDLITALMLRAKLRAGD